MCILLEKNNILMEFITFLPFLRFHINRQPTFCAIFACCKLKFEKYEKIIICFDAVGDGRLLWHVVTQR